MYKVIIVEDDPMVAEIDESYVEHNNKLTVVGVFSSGQSALEYVRNNHVDLIMLDLYMPQMDGREFLSTLRKEGGKQSIIMVTAANDAKSIGDLYHFGIVDYLIKPFDYTRFQVALNKFITHQESLDSADTFTQASLDKMLTPDTRENSQYVDKGIQAPTLELICQFLRQHKNEKLSIEDIVKEVALSRVTIRRYMNYLIEKNSVISGVDYTTGGRPSSIYTYIGK